MHVPENLKDFIVDLNNSEKFDQLSVKGMSLLMAIFADKEESENQPVIAGSTTSLQHLVSLIDNSPIGTELAIIFTPESDNEESWTNVLGQKKYDRWFSSFHKTTFILRKSAADKLEVIHVDGIATNSDYFEVPNYLILTALQKNATAYNKPLTQLISVEPDFPVNKLVKPEKVFNGTTYIYVSPIYKRQENGYICGVYAIKDGRYFSRDFKPETSVDIKVINTEFGKYLRQEYTVPAAVLRSSQAEDTIQYLMSGAYALDTPVNRKGTTLFSFNSKYPKAVDYINKFAQKYLDIIATFVPQNTADKIDSMVKRFDGAEFTIDDIIRINSARREMQTTPAAVFDKKSLAL